MRGQGDEPGEGEANTELVSASWEAQLRPEGGFQRPHGNISQKSPWRERREEFTPGFSPTLCLSVVPICFTGY